MACWPRPRVGTTQRIVLATTWTIVPAGDNPYESGSKAEFPCPQATKQAKTSAAYQRKAVPSEATTSKCCLVVWLPPVRLFQQVANHVHRAPKRSTQARKIRRALQDASNISKELLGGITPRMCVVKKEEERKTRFYRHT